MSKVLELKWIIEKNLNEQLDIIRKILVLGITMIRVTGMFSS